MNVQQSTNSSLTSYYHGNKHMGQNNSCPSVNGDQPIRYVHSFEHISTERYNTFKKSPSQATYLYCDEPSLLDQTLLHDDS